MNSRPRIAISLGDPGGIGPEITARVLADPAFASACIPIVYGNSAVWARACALVGLTDGIERLHNASDAKGPSLIECDEAGPEQLPYGHATAAAGRAQTRYLAKAVDDLVAGTVDGLCTAPVNKAAVHAAGLPFTGHTEYLQERFGVPRVVMLMAGKELRVALATMHMAVRDVATSLSTAELVEIGLLVSRELGTRFGITSPRIAILGLNPHAGEEGRFGDEEQRIIGPAIEALRTKGVRVEGPYPADGLFPRVHESGCDAVLAMYHDQGLIPFKMLEFHTGVNVTLGLPKPRTSPDHGVAYDIAGTGRADPRSMASALRLCIRLAGGSTDGLDR